MRVLIVRLGSMGDVLHALPAVAALRAAHLDAHIGWAIERRWTPFLVADGTPLHGPRSAQRPLVDRVHVVNTLAWRKAPLSGATWSDVRETFRELRAERYDLAIDFQGSIKSAIVAQLSGTISLIGFAQPREKAATMFYTSVVQPSGRHIIEQNLSLVRSVFPQCSSVPSVVNDLPYDPVAGVTAREKLPSKGEFVLLNPGAGWGAKQWPTARYGELARRLAADGRDVLIHYGPGEEALAREVEKASGGVAKPILCTLSELIEVCRCTSLFIGGDTGPMHLANAFDVPVVALFGPTDPSRNGPFENPIRPANPRATPGVWGASAVLRHPSSRTDYSHREQPDPGLLQITVEHVLSAVRRLGERHRCDIPQPPAESLEPGAPRPEPLS